MLEWKLEHKQSSVFHHPTFFFSLCFCGPDWENVVYYGPLELTDWKSDHQIEISFPIFICYNWSQSRPHAKRNIPEMLCYWEGVDDNSCLVNTETKTRVHQFDLGWCQDLDVTTPVSSHPAWSVGEALAGQIDHAMEVGILPDLRSENNWAVNWNLISDQ